MSHPLPLLFLCVLFPLLHSQVNIHLPLQRREIQTNFLSSDPDLKQLTCLVDNPDSPKKTKKASITELCFFRNLFYNVEVTMGSAGKKKFELTLDLLSPFTWVKSDNCSNCYSDPEGGFQCKKNCNMMDFTQTHRCLPKKKCQKTNTTAVLDYINHNITGKFVYENLQIHTMDQELKIKRFKVIDVQNITNAPNFNSDGVLGLALEDSEGSDNETAEADAGIMTSIINAAQKMEDRVFSVYIRENDPDDEDYQPAIVFGDYNPEYQDNQDEVIKWVKINNGSRFDWDLPVSSLNIKGEKLENSEIIFEKNSAILTLDTTFIGLPVKVLNRVVDYLNKVGMGCSVDKDKFDSLMCEKVTKGALSGLKLNFVFQDDEEKISKVNVDPMNLIKNCEGELGDKAISCYFQIHQSHSKSTILGEAFMKNFYTIFNMEEERVGLVTAASKADEPITHIVRREGRKFSRFLKYFFILLGVILAILCPFYLYQVCKIYRRKKDVRYDDGNNNTTIDRIGDDTAYDFQAEMKEKLEARKKAEEEKKKEGNAAEV